MVRLVGVVCVLAGCGRLSFEPIGEAPSDAGDDVALSGFCGAFSDAIYCNDFTTPDLRGATNQNGVTHDPAGGVDGTGGMVFDVSPGFGQSLYVNMPADITAGTLSFGARMNVVGQIPLDDYVVLGQLSNTADKVSFDLVPQNRIQLVNTVASNYALGSAGSFPRDRWFCYELRVELSTDGAGGEVQLFIDGVSILTAFQGQATVPAGGYLLPELAAFPGPDTSGPVRVLADNWIVAQRPIGCP